MSNRKFAITTAYARRIPDPVFHKSHRIERHIFLVRVKDLPEGLPDDPNARLPNTKKRVYREIEASLLNGDGHEPGTFHLKHKGITIIASSVQRDGDDQYTIVLKPGHGIVDGGHTYRLILDNQDNSDLPDDQYVKLEVITNIPEDWIAEIAGGLNTSVQVQDMSLDHLAGRFDWIKQELESESYFDALAWREGEDGEYDARDIIAIMTCFLIEVFPNNGSEHPIFAYEKKSKALQLFEEQPEAYTKLQPILKDILRLHDTIALEARSRWNEETKGKAGRATFMEENRSDFIFIDQDASASDYRLSNAALYPMLAAFRWMVEEDPKSKKYRWRGGFKATLERWAAAAPDLMKHTFNQNTDSGRTPNALGKSRAHWNNLHTLLRALDQDAQLAELRKRAGTR